MNERVLTVNQGLIKKARNSTQGVLPLRSQLATIAQIEVQNKHKETLLPQLKPKQMLRERSTNNLHNPLVQKKVLSGAVVASPRVDTRYVKQSGIEAIKQALKQIEKQKEYLVNQMNSEE